MEEISPIKLSVHFGFSQLSILASKKNAQFLEMLAMTTEISTYVNKERLSYKIRKRISQQKATSEINTKESQQNASLNLVCYNSQLSWQDANMKIENENIAFPSSLSVLDVFHVCSTIEKESFVDDSII